MTYADPFTGLAVRTGTLPYNATAEQLQSALNKVVGNGNSVTVSQNIQTILSVNAVQQMTLTDSRITSGGSQRWFATQTGNDEPTRFQLSYLGVTSGNIAYTGNSTTDAAAIQAALNGISTIGAGNTVVTDLTVAGGDEVFRITFVNALGAQPVGLIGFNIGGPDVF